MSHAIDKSSVLVVGAGGLGGPIAYALAAAGAHRLVLCDDDVVELSNLQRQVQFRSADIGRAKVEALAEALCERGYARAAITTAKRRFTADSAAELLRGIDLIVDGSDSLPTKFAVNDAAVARGLPAVIAAVTRYTGQIAVVRPGAFGCYRCLFEAPPAEDDGASSCAAAGVLGAAVAVIAGHAAQAALDLIAGRGGDSRVDVFDDVSASSRPRTIRFRRTANCRACAGARVYHPVSDHSPGQNLQEDL